MGIVVENKRQRSGYPEIARDVHSYVIDVATKVLTVEYSS